MDVQQFLSDLSAPQYRYRMASGTLSTFKSVNRSPADRMVKSAQTRLADAERDIIAVVTKYAHQLEEENASDQTPNP